MEKIIKNTVSIGNVIGLTLIGLVYSVELFLPVVGLEIFVAPIFCFWCGVAFVIQFGKYYLHIIEKSELIFKTICFAIMSVLFYLGIITGTFSHLSFKFETGIVMLIGYFIAPLLVCYGIGYLIFGSKNTITISKEEYDQLKQNQIKSKGGYLELEDSSKD